MNLFTYNFKLLSSPLKWIFCLIFTILIPISMYSPTFFDLTNICEIYMPLIGVTLITDIMLIDTNNNVHEYLHILNNHPQKNFLLRYFIIFILILIFVLIADATFFIRQYLNSEPKNTVAVFHFQFLIIVTCSTLFLGTLSMSIANIFKNPFLAYIISFIYWLYWNINHMFESVFNLFPFIANPRGYKDNLLILFSFIGILLLLNLIWVKRSPFFTPIRLRTKIFK